MVVINYLFMLFRSRNSLFPIFELNNYSFYEKGTIFCSFLSLTVYRILLKLFMDSWPGASYTVKLHDTTVVKHHSTAVGDFLDAFLLKLWALCSGGKRTSQSPFNRKKWIPSSDSCEAHLKQLFYLRLQKFRVMALSLLKEATSDSWYHEYDVTHARRPPKEHSEFESSMQIGACIVWLFFKAIFFVMET